MVGKLSRFGVLCLSFWMTTRWREVFYRVGEGEEKDCVFWRVERGEVFFIVCGRLRVFDEFFLE